MALGQMLNLFGSTIDGGNRHGGERYSLVRLTLNLSIWEVFCLFKI